MTEAVISSVARGSTPRVRARARDWQGALLRVLALLAGLVLWEWASDSKFSFFVHFENVPAPSRVWSELASLLGHYEIYRHVLTSLRRIAISFTLAASVGIGLGLLIGRFRLAAELLLPYVEILRPIPAVAWIPLAILIWPTEESSILFITFLGAVFPILLNTVHGVRGISGVLIQAARSLGAGEAGVFRHVILPGAMPSIATGLAVGVGVSWFSVLTAEIISGQFGIGYFTWVSYNLVQYPRIIIGMLIIGMLGTASTWLVRLATRPLLRWQTFSR